MSLPDQALGLADPPLDVAARAVLFLVALPEPVELGGGVPPRLVDGRLALRGLPLDLGGGLTGRLGRRGGLFEAPDRLLGLGARVFGGLEIGAQANGVVGREPVALGAQLVQARVVHPAVAAQGLHRDTLLHGRLRCRRKLGHLLVG